MGPLKPWSRMGSRTLYERSRVRLREDTLEMPDGQQRVYPVMDLGRSVGILPFISDAEVLLVRQYRHVTNDFAWEVPGGSMEPGELPEAAAQRELREESGYRAGRLRHLGPYWPSNAYLDEIIHVFAAEDLTPDPLPGDEDEDLEARRFPFAEAVAMAQDERITCGLTKLAILWAAVARGRW